MICLNKADEGTFKHLSFNQSPPALAPSHTTRQDLNGIANLREFVAGGQDVNGGDASAVGANGDRGGPDVWHHEPWPVAAALDARRRPCTPAPLSH